MKENFKESQRKSKKDKKKKVLFISSTGGHLNELLQLAPLFEKYDYKIITEKDKANEKLKEQYGEKLYFLPYGTRAKLFTYIFKYFYLCLKTKPFVILSGISGTGKSKMVKLFAEALGANSKNNRFKMIPVKPEWSDSTDLLGYRNIEGNFILGIITSIAYSAIKNPKFPYFICLDEMNLARVEYYFSDILSLMETRRRDSNFKIVTEKFFSKEQFGKDKEAFEKYKDIYIPDNCKVKIKSNSIFGGVSNNKKCNVDDNSYTIYINASCMFGGVEIK